MPSLRLPATQSQDSVVEIIGPESGTQWLRARLIRLSAKQPEWTFQTGEEEAVLDILGGLCTVSIRSESGSDVYPEFGGRSSAFAGKPTMGYIPRRAGVSVFAESAAFEALLVS